jgi:methionyl-tRNA synthetase
MACQRAFITTPIFYVNAIPHLGHLSSALLADAQARWLRLCGKDVVFSTGTDEHGLKVCRDLVCFVAHISVDASTQVMQAADRENIPPAEFCARNSLSFRNLFDRAGISYTDFIRTTEPRHAAVVTSFWERLQQQGHIYLGEHEGHVRIGPNCIVRTDSVTVAIFRWYSVSDETFVPQAQTEERADGVRVRYQGEANSISVLAHAVW